MVVVKTPRNANAGSVGLIPGRLTKIPHAVQHSQRLFLKRKRVTVLQDCMNLESQCTWSVGSSWLTLCKGELPTMRSCWWERRIQAHLYKGCGGAQWTNVADTLSPIYTLTHLSTTASLGEETLLQAQPGDS